MDEKSGQSSVSCCFPFISHPSNKTKTAICLHRYLCLLIDEWILATIKRAVCSTFRQALCARLQARNASCSMYQRNGTDLVNNRSPRFLKGTSSFVGHSATWENYEPVYSFQTWSHSFVFLCRCTPQQFPPVIHGILSQSSFLHVWRILLTGTLQESWTSVQRLVFF